MDYSPKRMRYKDNPYRLSIENNKYYVEFNNNKVEVSKEVYELYDESERHDVKELNEYSRNIEHFQTIEDEKTNIKIKGLEFVDEVELKDLIETLTRIQKRRLIKYYMEGKTLRKIAKEEAVSFQVIYKSIQKALKNLQKNQKN